tara:strand:- start:1678 stop:3393 length:1716 start_codon:yes stop_codon:yes gene_type:complete
MCGIFAIINNTINDESLYKKSFYNGKKRGPEYSVIENIDISNSLIIGFHRLAINGYNDKLSDQPLQYNDCTLICNGEIYNYSDLYKLSGTIPNTKSDCEIIIHLYKKYGMEQTLQMLDGVFAFMLIDHKEKFIYIGRDTYGIRPMFVCKETINDKPQYIIASEIKQIVPLISNETNIKSYKPGTYSKFSFVDGAYKLSFRNRVFSSPNGFINNTIRSEKQASIFIKKTLEAAVEKRVRNTDRDIACLLSGGLDSSLIASLVQKYHRKYYPSKKLHTWSIGLKGSEDLKYAKKVATFIKSEHHSIEIDKEEMLSAIEEVIYNIESYDTTSVRASIPNYLISKYIKKYEDKCDAKVIFNGDGSDEVTGGYIYFHYIKNMLEFDKECRRLLKDIHYFDVLRSDRSISSNGLEARTPFLDRNFVQTYLSIPYHLRCHSSNKLCEKYLLRKTFDDGITLPDEVLWRTKEAFSDGVSNDKEAWFETINKFVKSNIFSNDSNYPEKEEDIINMMIKEKNITHNLPTTLEQLYYRLLFEKHFPNKGKIIPYFWMPTYGDTKDASARTLDIYNKVNRNKL